MGNIDKGATRAAIAPGGITAEVLIYPHCFGAEAFGVADVLHLANRLAVARGSPAPFSVTLVSVDAAPVESAVGACIAADRPAGSAGLLIVPGFDMPPRGELGAFLAARRAECDLIMRSRAEGATVAAVCVGAFLVGAAGLIDHRRATTAWAFARALQRRHPEARVDAKALLVDDDGVITTGAFSAAFDLGLELVRRHGGAGLAAAVARLGLIESGRTSQAAFVDDRLFDRATGSFSQGVEAWLGTHLAEPYDLTALAARFSVSPRTLLRRFKAETGLAPLHALQTARIAMAKDLLASSALGLAEIGQRVGYRDPSSFHTLFTSRVGLSPASYRRRFRQPERLA